MGTSPDTSATLPQLERQQENREAQREVDFMNVQLKAFYDVEVTNWLGLQVHGPTQDPVPNPPMKWAALPRTDRTQDQIDWDTRFGLPPQLVPTRTNEPVCPKFVPPPPMVVPGTPHTGTTVHVGQFYRIEQRVIGGNTVDVLLFAALPDDDMPPGFGVPWAYQGQPVMLHKVVSLTPGFGKAQWYEGAAQSNA